MLCKQKEQHGNAEKFLQAADVNSSILEKNGEKSALEKELKELNKVESKSRKKLSKKRRREAPCENTTHSVDTMNESSVSTDVYISSDSSHSNENDPVIPPLRAKRNCQYDLWYYCCSPTEWNHQCRICSEFSRGPKVVDLATLGNTSECRLNSDECLAKYMKYVKQNLTEGRKVNDDLYITCIKDMSLAEFVMAVKRHCTDIHGDRICVKCKPGVMAANEIVEKGIVPLSVLYRKFSGTVYKSDKAICRLLQFPVIIFRSFN